ncbi:MAG: ABC transporter permease [Clostridia bacterium]|nr:ABC transporter permease [Clostridia bacterium]
MRMLTFANRNTKEILRDPINLCFGIGFPLVLILLLSAIQANIPENAVNLFEIQSLAPGITVFGLSFMTLFSAKLISKDRGSSLLQRLYTTPMKPLDFIFGYTLPIIPIAMAQSAVCYIAAIVLGLEVSANILVAIVFVAPISILFISLGLLFGSILTDKQVGGICGGLLTNLSAWLSGTWFDLNLVGGVFKDIAYALPFVHAVELERAVLAGNYSGIFPHLWWVLGYAAAATTSAVLLFLRQMKKQ